jgi:UDP-GlcNAc:undecaprenyl-phosphate/decaprenyl-phosphate GlcNAc-1-phosphate transferase
MLVVLVAAIALYGLRALAFRLDWLDQPDARKVHSAPVPAVGGIAWLIALLVGAAVGGALLLHPYLFSALALIGVLGAIDDRRPLPSGLRLLVQMFAALLAFWDGAILQQLGQIFWPGAPIALGVLAWPFTVFATVGVINAFNMFDGMDGLLGVISFALLCLLTTLFYRHGAFGMAQICSMALTALIPFLIWNVRTPWLKKARVFFGDAGSMSLGLLIAWIIVQGAQLGIANPAANGASTDVSGVPSSGIFTPSVGLFLIAVPLIDTVSLMLRRIGRRGSPFAPDQDHVHHVLQRAGYSVSMSLLILLLASIAMQTLGLGMHYLDVAQSVQVLVFLSLALLMHIGLQHAVKNGRLWGRPVRYTLSD